MTKLEYALSLVSRGVLSVDSQGRIWRHYIGHRWGMNRVRKRRAERSTKKGYLAVYLCMGQKTRCVLAHLIVWNLKHGPVPIGLQINHKDASKSNNRPRNLELMTGSENMKHSYLNGRIRPWSKATEWRLGIPRKTEKEIRRALRILARHGAAETSKRTGISTTHLYRLRDKYAA